MVVVVVYVVEERMCEFCMGWVEPRRLLSVIKNFVDVWHTHIDFPLFPICACITLPIQSGTIVCWLVAYAMGAQNAMTTFFSGAIVRTTHVTGSLTDIGIETAALFLRRSGMKCGHKTWKLEVLLCFVAGFFAGALIFPVLCVTTHGISLLVVHICRCAYSQNRSLL